jgi:hypothetical protein
MKRLILATITLSLLFLIGAAPDPQRMFYAINAFTDGYLDRELDYPSRPTGGEFTAATDTFGPLIVQIGNFSAKANVQPWSSWWYPRVDDSLFQGKNGELSPLEKYDQYTQKTLGTSAGAADFERTQLYDPRAESWAGLCDAWSFASLTMPEPKAPIVASGITFTVADQKALLLKTFENVDPASITHYGQRNDGSWDSVYEDIYPDQLHRFLLAGMFERHQAFVMDEDAGIEIWNTPVYQAEIKIDADPKDQTVLHVRTSLVSASSDVQDPNIVGTIPMIHVYTYDLHGMYLHNGDFLVDYGQWTDSSRWDHPDYVMTIPNKPKRASLNTKIDPAIVDRIIQEK